MVRFSTTSVLALSLALTALLPIDRACAKKDHVLYAFTGGLDGSGPVGRPLLGQKDVVVGATNRGGANTFYGTLFEIGRGGEENTLYAFNATDGAPTGGVIADSKGNLYGTTYNAVYEFSNGVETLLHVFPAHDAGGYNVDGGVVMDGQGNVYGTTDFGGADDAGVVFKIAPDGTESLLHSFQYDTDGYSPTGGLTLDADGNLYGVTLAYGPGGSGTVFKLAPDGTFTLLHAFTGGADGGQPLGGVVLDSAGNVFGTASQGGAHYGLAYEITTKGAFKELYYFKGNQNGNTDGLSPEGPLVIDTAGNLYGVTEQGGSANAGIVFKLSKKGKEAILYNFQGGNSDGAYPQYGLTMDEKCFLYGLTPQGYGTGCGGSGCGTAFKVKR